MGIFFWKWPGLPWAVDQKMIQAPYLIFSLFPELLNVWEFNRIAIMTQSVLYFICFIIHRFRFFIWKSIVFIRVETYMRCTYYMRWILFTLQIHSYCLVNEFKSFIQNNIKNEGFNLFYIRPKRDGTCRSGQKLLRGRTGPKNFGPLTYLLWIETREITSYLIKFPRFVWFILLATFWFFNLSFNLRFFYFTFSLKYGHIL